MQLVARYWMVALSIFGVGATAVLVEACAPPTTHEGQCYDGIEAGDGCTSPTQHPGDHDYVPGPNADCTLVMPDGLGGGEHLAHAKDPRRGEWCTRADGSVLRPA